MGEHLAFTGAVRDEILDMEGLAARLLELLLELYPNAVTPAIRQAFPRKSACPGMCFWNRWAASGECLFPGER